MRIIQMEPTRPLVGPGLTRLRVRSKRDEREEDDEPGHEDSSVAAYFQ